MCLPVYSLGRDGNGDHDEVLNGHCNELHALHADMERLDRPQRCGRVFAGLFGISTIPHADCGVGKPAFQDAALADDGAAQESLVSPLQFVQDAQRSAGDAFARLFGVCHDDWVGRLLLR